VCSTYLYDGDDVAADPWLYNRFETPLQPEWRLPNARDLLPFMNSAEYVYLRNFDLPVCENSFRVGCVFDENMTLKYAEVFLFEQTIAKLVPGRKPSYSRLSRLANSIAQPLPT
jgi:hypothetical protein